MGTEDPCALWVAVPEAPAETQGGEPQSWGGEQGASSSRDPPVPAGSQGEPTHDPLPPQTDSTPSRSSQWPCAVAPAAREAERGWRRRSRAGVAETGAREAGPELGAELRDQRGCAPGPPGTETRAPLQSHVASQRPGGEEPATGVTQRRQSLILLPGRSLGAAVPPGTGRHPPPRPGPASPSLGVGSASREAPRACARAAALAILPVVLQAPPRPPSSRVTRVDRRRGTRAGPWRSR